jgi:hypothetical protein
MLNVECMQNAKDNEFGRKGELLSHPHKLRIKYIG